MILSRSTSVDDGLIQRSQKPKLQSPPCHRHIEAKKNTKAPTRRGSHPTPSRRKARPLWCTSYYVCISQNRNHSSWSSILPVYMEDFKLRVFMYVARYSASTVPGCATGARPSAVAVSRSATSFEAPAEISSSVLSFVSGTIVCAHKSKRAGVFHWGGWADG